jgi:phosphate transporter
VGGMASPIASPQNVISMGIMSPPPSWLQWFTISLPIVIILDLCIWFVLLFYFQVGNEVVLPPEIHTRTIEPFNRKQWGIVFVCILTIVLWCVEGQIEQYVGDMGIIAGFELNFILNFF